MTSTGPGPEALPEPETYGRYETRRDVSGVAPQGSYVAKRCPVRVQFDRFPPPDTAPAPPGSGARLRMDQGIEFEQGVFDELLRLHPDAVVIDPAHLQDHQQAATAAAMADGAALILGGWLPTDLAGRRTGRPDLLLRAEARPDGRWSYQPADVKHHLTLRDREPKPEVPGPVLAELAAPHWASATEDRSCIARPRTDDLLQLAHYHRMLEAMGHASQEPAGAIVGKEQVAVWHRLDVPMVAQLWDGSVEAREAPLQRYDFEFSFRLDVLAAAEDGAPIVEPVLVPECADCPWREHCLPVMEAADSTSLLPRISYRQWKTLKEAGISTRADLARLDEPSPELRERFRVLKTDLDEAILGARVVSGGGPPELRPGVDALTVPAADVEIDIDMENSVDGTVYLWGAWVGDHYESFADWTGTGPEVDGRVFLAFWDWLDARRSAAQRSGHSLAVYCWFQNAERGALDRGATAAAEHLGRDLRSEVAAFVEGPEWFDLYETFTRQLITGTGSSLKVVARLAGFAWRDADPSGEASMAWHQQATDPSDRGAAAAARARLLAYNEDDVRATAAVRHWMRSLA